MARRPPSLSPECPECGAQYCKQRQTGADDFGQRIRERVCRDCGHRFITVEAVIPGVRFAQVDVERKAYQKLWKRERYGWWGQRTYKRPTPFLVRVLVSVFDPNRKGSPMVHEVAYGQKVTSRRTVPRERVA